MLPFLALQCELYAPKKPKQIPPKPNSSSDSDYPQCDAELVRFVIQRFKKARNPL